MARLDVTRPCLARDLFSVQGYADTSTAFNLSTLLKSHSFHFSFSCHGCPADPTHSEKGGNVRCYKANGNGASAGVCGCGAGGYPPGNCF